MLALGEMADGGINPPRGVESIQDFEHEILSLIAANGDARVLAMEFDHDVGDPGAKARPHGRRGAVAGEQPAEGGIDLAAES